MQSVRSALLSIFTSQLCVLTHSVITLAPTTSFTILRADKLFDTLVLISYSRVTVGCWSTYWNYHLCLDLPEGLT